MKKKILLASIVALTLALLVAVGGSIAWLVAESTEIENVFTPSDINISLTETPNLDFQMVPGDRLVKDPTVSVLNTTNVDVWLFVEVTESANLDEYIAYAIADGADGWKLYDGSDTGADANSATVTKYVIFREVKVADTDKEFNILGNGVFGDQQWDANYVFVKPSVTKEDMETIYNDLNLKPTLTFKAVAVQTDNLTLQDAYAQAFPSTTP